MEKDIRFKPLWKIHNATYRRLNKGVLSRRLNKYFKKVLKMVKLNK